MLSLVTFSRAPHTMDPVAGASRVVAGNQGGDGNEDGIDGNRPTATEHRQRSRSGIRAPGTRSRAHAQIHCPAAHRRRSGRGRGSAPGHPRAGIPKLRHPAPGHQLPRLAQPDPAEPLHRRLPHAQPHLRGISDIAGLGCPGRGARGAAGVGRGHVSAARGSRPAARPGVSRGLRPAHPARALLCGDRCQAGHPQGHGGHTPGPGAP